MMRLAYAFGRRGCGSKYRMAGVLLGMLGSLVTILVLSDGSAAIAVGCTCSPNVRSAPHWSHSVVGHEDLRCAHSGATTRLPQSARSGHRNSHAFSSHSHAQICRALRAPDWLWIASARHLAVGRWHTKSFQGAAAHPCALVSLPCSGAPLCRWP